MSEAKIDESDLSALLCEAGKRIAEYQEQILQLEDTVDTFEQEIGSLDDRINSKDFDNHTAKEILTAFVTEYCDREEPEDMPVDAAGQSCSIVIAAMGWLDA
jgi:chromosome segregation ATPase